MAKRSPEEEAGGIGAGSADEHRAKRLLESYGVPVVDEVVAMSPEKAAGAAERLGYPVALKGAGAALQHKTERQLVRLHLRDAEAVMSAARSIEEEAKEELEFFLVQPMVSGQRELLAGFFRDPHFGPIIVFGLGGTLSEALDDVVIRLAPLSSVDVEDMARGIRARVLLKDFRGESRVREEDLKRVLNGLSALAEEHPEITEVDINPLKVTPSGHLVAVDALIVAGEQQPPRRARPKASTRSLHAVFHPKSVAFVGASAQMGKWGYLLVVNTIAGGFTGKIHLVNPKGGTILGRRVHRTLGEVPGPVDLVVVTIPAKHTIGLIEECRAKGVEHIVMISSGFSEIGEEGRALEEQLVEAARKAGILILGPNTMGIANSHTSFLCTGSTVTPRIGSTAMVSQSGNLGTQLLAFAEHQGLGIRAFAGSGNEAMVTIEDFLDAFLEDELTHTVLLYLESCKDGRRFFESARRLSAAKPVLLLKGGRTPVGLRAAASHTGALASDERVFDAMCEQAGVIKVEQPMELLDLAAAFSSLPLPKGPRTAIMTWGGGWGVVTADLCEKHGLEIPELDAPILQEIDAILPPYWSRMNPVDLVGDQDPLVPMRILEALACWEGCDAVLSLGILGRRVFMHRFGQAVLRADPSVGEELLSQVATQLGEFEDEFIKHSVMLMERYGKPIIGVSLLADAESKMIRGVPEARHEAVFYETPEGAVKALSAMVTYQREISRR